MKYLDIQGWFFISTETTQERDAIKALLKSLDVAPAPAPQTVLRGLAFKAPAPHGTLKGLIKQSKAIEVVGTGIKSVRFSIDGATLNTEQEPPWQMDLDTRKHANGTHTLEALATFSDGVTGTVTLPVSIQN